MLYKMRKIFATTVVFMSSLSFFTQVSMSQIMGDFTKSSADLFKTVLKIDPLDPWNIGGWTGGGGGELLGDALNPWFIANSTKEIKYCIISNEKNFPTPKYVLNSYIRQAFSYWDEQFKSGFIGMNGLRLQIANYRQVKCDHIDKNSLENTDLFFLFGALPPELSEALNSKPGVLERHLAITVRTHYDPEILRGKGFIYFAPEKGELKKITDVSYPLWQGYEGPQRLHLSIIHELGHVFGLDHEQGGIMARDLIENMFMGEYPLLLFPPYSPLYLPKKSWGGSCISGSAIGTPVKEGVSVDDQGGKGNNQEISDSKEGNSQPVATLFSEPLFFQSRVFKYFSAPEGHNCYNMEFNADANGLLDVTFKSKKGGQAYWDFTVHGKFSSRFGQKLEEKIRLWLPKEQTVFPVSEGSQMRYITGLFASEISCKGFFEFERGNASEAIITFKRDGAQIGGVKDGKFYPNIEFDNYLSL